MALPLKSGLDLYNNEALRMRLHNLGADPASDFGVGQVYFNTSTSEGSGKRVRIYDGSAFRSLAYFDEIDNRLKLLEGEIDTDAIISNMKEVSAFLAGFAEDASLMDVLNGKLDKAGGTITDTLILQYANPRILYYDASGNHLGNIGFYDGVASVFANNKWAAILTSAGGTISDRLSLSFAPTSPSQGMINIHTGDATKYPTVHFGGNISWGSFGFTAANTPTYFDNSFRPYTLLHSGNVGGYASLVGAIDGNTDLSNLGSGIYGTLKGISGVPFDSAGNTIIHSRFDANAATQLFLRYSADELYYRRRTGGTWSDWKTIAFTDSDITGSARSLKAADGNTFALVNTEGHVVIGNEKAKAGYNTHIEGNFVVFRYGTSNTIGLLLNNNGYVGIGITNPQYMLDVNGTANLDGLRFRGNDTVTFDNCGNIKLNSRAVTYWHIDTNDGNPVLAAHASGNVLIGTSEDNGEKLQVAGHAFISNTLSTGSYFDLNRSAVSGVISDTTRMALEMQAQATNIRFSLFDKNGVWKGIPMEFLENGDIHVSGNLIVDGEVSAGGAGEEGDTSTGTGGGDALIYSQEFTPTTTSITITHNLSATKGVIVQVWEKNGNYWDMVLVDVEEVDTNTVTLFFGKTETTVHKVVIMG